MCIVLGKPYRNKLDLMLRGGTALNDGIEPPVGRARRPRSTPGMLRRVQVAGIWTGPREWDPA